MAYCLITNHIDVDIILFQKKLFKEIKGRIKLDDESLHFFYKKDGWEYWTKTTAENNYPIQLRKKRTIKRKGMKKKILNKIINNQLTDTYKKNRADFIVNTSTSKTQSFNKISQIINLIKTDKYA